ncbi:MAG: hypothetical protein ACFFAN_08465 [Promethearchaeota archaeon]
MIYIRKLEQMEFNNNDIFENLDYLALSDTNHELRYIATKIILKKVNLM